jgi:hypothetical protein
MNLNGKQVIAIIVAVMSVMIGSTAQLTDLFGVNVAKTIVSVASLGTSVLSAILAVLTSQGSMIMDVKNMPGVEKIDVNAMANKTLATIAVDPQQDKISPTPAAMDKVTQTAKGT